jgi:purine catabolism regulator
MPPQTGRVLTIHELVYDSGLDIRLAGGAGGLHRRVEAVHISENEDVLRWIPRGTLLLTTGVRIKSKHQTGVVLLRDLMSSGMSGLLLSLGIHLKTVPPSLTEEADRIRFPLLYTESDIPLRVVTRYVDDALASHEMHRLRRSVSLQSELVGLLAEEQGMQRFATRLSGLLDAGIVVLDESGDVEAASGVEAFSISGEVVRNGLPDSAWAGEADAPMIFTIEGHHVAYERISVEGVLHGFLAVVHRGSRTSVPEFESDTLAFARRLLGTSLHTKRSEPARAAGSRLLTSLVTGSDMPERIDKALGAHSITTRASSRVGVVRLGTSQEASQQDALTSIETSLSTYVGQMGVPCLTTVLAGGVVFLTSLRASGTELEREFYSGLLSRIRGAAVDECCLIGLSRPLTALDGVKSSYLQAIRALSAAGRRQSGGVYFHEDLGFVEEVLDSLEDGQLLALVDSVVAPLLPHDNRHRSQLHDTLEAYLSSDMSLRETAEKLHLHRNSLRYRLSQAEAVLGLSLDSTEDLVTIYLGFRAAEVLAAKSVWRRPPGNPADG